MQCSVPLFVKQNPGVQLKELSYCNIFRSQTGIYVGINPTMTLKMRYIRSYSERYTQYEKTDLVYINQRTVNYLIVAMDQFWNRFQREDLFHYDERGIVDEVCSTEDDIAFIPMEYSQLIKIQPCMYIPNTGRVQAQNPVPGIAIIVNLDSHVATLSPEEFKELQEVIRKVDFNLYPQVMIQNYLSMKLLGMIPEYRGPAEPVAKETQSKGLQAFGARVNNSDSGEMVSKEPIIKEPVTLEDL